MDFFGGSRHRKRSRCLRGKERRWRLATFPDVSSKRRNGCLPSQVRIVLYFLFCFVFHLTCFWGFPYKYYRATDRATDRVTARVRDDANASTVSSAYLSRFFSEHCNIQTDHVEAVLTTPLGLVEFYSFGCRRTMSHFFQHLFCSGSAIIALPCTAWKQWQQQQQRSLSLSLISLFLSLASKEMILVRLRFRYHDSIPSVLVDEHR